MFAEQTDDFSVLGENRTSTVDQTREWVVPTFGFGRGFWQKVNHPELVKQELRAPSDPLSRRWRQDTGQRTLSTRLADALSGDFVRLRDKKFNTLLPTMHLWRSIAVPSAFLSLVCLPLFTQSQQPLAYQARSNRYEGLQSEFNAKPRFEVRGIFGREDLTSATPDPDLKLSFYIPPNGTLLNIQAQELKRNKGYLMVPKLPLPGATAGQWATFSPWPASEVLAKVHIQPDQLGVVVSLRLPNLTNVYAPVLFYTDRVLPNINAYSIFFSSDKSVGQVRCTVVDEHGHNKSSNNTPYTCNLPNRETSFLSGVTKRFEVNAGNLPPGLVTITITGEYTNDESGEGLHAVLHFYHQPQVNIR